MAQDVTINANDIVPYANDFHTDLKSTTVFGFWVYLMTDCFLFATLFAVFATMPQMPSEHGLFSRDLFDLNLILLNTLFLLASSVTFGMAMLHMIKENLQGIIMWLIPTLIFGWAFLGIELYEFNHLIHEGAGFWVNAYWASFFALVGTHGLHVTVGSIWMLVLFIHFKKDGLTLDNKVRLSCLSLFWHFLDLVWIGVFSVVYLLGVL